MVKGRTANVFDRSMQLLTPGLIVLALCARSFAADTVVRKDSTVQLLGRITGMNNEGITIEVGSKKAETKVPANEIIRIRFDGEPALLNSVRNKEESGHLAEALDGYKEFLDKAPAGAALLADRSGIPDSANECALGVKRSVADGRRRAPTRGVPQVAFRQLSLLRVARIRDKAPDGARTTTLPSWF